jgi:hypothetical protein
MRSQWKQVSAHGSWILGVALFSVACSASSPTPPDPVPSNPPGPQSTPAPVPQPTPTPMPPPPPPPPSGTAAMSWSLTDACNDGRGIGVKLFDKTDNLVWPNAYEFYVAPPGGTVSLAIGCQRGAKICYGAEPNPPNGYHWGVGLNGTQGCDTCCYSCADTTISLRLTCG